MPVKYEYVNTGAVDYAPVAGDLWFCQTFTPQITHDLTLVLPYLFTNEVDGVHSPDVVAGIQNTTGADNHPDGTDLVSATFDREELTINDETPERKGIVLPKYRVYKDITYAIVLRMPDALKDEVVNWWFSEDGVTYPRGLAGVSDDGGVTWFMAEEADFLFEEWGEPLVEAEHSLVQSELLLLLRR